VFLGLKFCNPASKKSVACLSIKFCYHCKLHVCRDVSRLGGYMRDEKGWFYGETPWIKDSVVTLWRSCLLGACYDPWIDCGNQLASFFHRLRITAHVFHILTFRLCPALKAVFEHGLKRSSLLGGPGHPWLFIEEVRCFLGFYGTRLR
jgi:hypothetical protein